MKNIGKIFSGLSFAFMVFSFIPSASCMKANRYQPITPAQHQQIIQMHQNGENPTTISQALQINFARCVRCINEYQRRNNSIDDFSKEEDLLLIQKYQELGPKWKQISLFFTNKSAIQLKTRYKSLVRRQSAHKKLFDKTLKGQVQIDGTTLTKQDFDLFQTNFNLENIDLGFFDAIHDGMFYYPNDLLK